jgi:hypothetical protein
MKRMQIITLGLVGMMTTVAWASSAGSSAEVGSRYGVDRAAATANYDGRVGFARTKAKTGKINLARGVALGIDREGISFSISNAIGGKRASLASNLNVSFGRDGDHSVSMGSTVSRGNRYHSAQAGGSASSYRGRSSATAAASGDADRYGSVSSRVSARDYPRRTLVYREGRDQRKIERLRTVKRVLKKIFD